MQYATISDFVQDVKSSNWIEIGDAFVHSASYTFKYHMALYEFICSKKEYQESVIFEDDTWAKVQVFSLALIFRLWSLKHYRSKSFQQDMIDNLRNVAIPGTGIPLSLFCYSYWTCLYFVVCINPMICLFGALFKAWLEAKKFEDFVKLTGVHYVNHLVHPDDWFSFWRLNCRLVSYHSHATQSADYKQEDKWTFLTTGREMNVPVSPFIETMDAIVCKHKKIEGGMGIHFYKNAAHGGDWILQERLHNAAWLNELLPNNAPLSTMRVITTSSWSLSEEFSLRKSASIVKSVSSAVLFDPDLDVSQSGFQQSFGEQMPPKTSESESTHSLLFSVDSHGSEKAGSPSSIAQQPEEELLATSRKYIRAESGVLRLGRESALTDHSCMLFDVDLSTGVIKGGTTNGHWYQLGVAKAVECPWLPAISGAGTHPDYPNPVVAGKTIPDLQKALDIVTTTHYKMMPDVPIVGWDVAFTPNGVFLLEVNLSCNFFRGSFDVPKYIELVDKYWVHLEKIEKLNQSESGKRKYKRSGVN